MFRRMYSTFFRFAQAAPRLSGSNNKKNGYFWLSGFLGAQLGAATMFGSTDEELARRPKWYIEAVHSLERAIHETSRHDYIEKKKILDDAKAILLKFKELNNPEIFWRLSRVYTEQAALLPSGQEKIDLLREAYNYATKAVLYEKKPIADLHKWYAITTLRIAEFDRKIRKNKAVVVEHLQKALEIDPNDPFSWQLLGIEKLGVKEYKEALRCFEKAEEISPNFSPANHYYLGRAYMLLKEKEKAINEFKTVFKLPMRTELDLRTRIEARKYLGRYGVPSEEYDPDFMY